MNTVTALVPIKSFSSRLPNKNFLDFGGRPLFHHLLLTLSDTIEVNNIIVNTDSVIVAEDCNKYFPKVKIHFRPERLRAGEVSGNELIDYDLSLDKGEHYLQSHVTNPLLTTRTLSNAIHAYFDKLNDYDSLITAEWIRKRCYMLDGTPINHNVLVMQQTQDLNPVIAENSNIFIFSRSSFYGNNKSRYGKKYQIFPMSPIESVDIDYEEEFNLAKLIFKNRDKFRTLLG